MDQTVFLGLLGILVGAAVLWPLLKRGGTAQRPGEAVVERTDAPDELAELVMDREMGRISDADYERLKARLAVPVVASPAAPAPGAVGAGSSSAPEAASAGASSVPEAVGAGAVPAPLAVRGGAAVGSSRAEALVQRWKSAARPTCATCGLRPEPAARFCSNCGAPLA